jgi:hypothetical protein
MSSTAQILANQKNAQSSTGPTTPEGIATAARNSTKHGFTGQTIIFSSPSEKDAYEAHVASYRSHHKARSHRHIELVQELADLHWSIHQIFTHQSNQMTLMTAVSTQLAASGADAITIASSLVPLTRTLNTLSTYETRRRRAAKSVQGELDALEADLLETALPEAQLPPPQKPVGSVCASYVKPASPAEFAKQCRDFEARMEAEEASNPRLKQF